MFSQFSCIKKKSNVNQLIFRITIFYGSAPSQQLESVPMWCVCQYIKHEMREKKIHKRKTCMNMTVNVGGVTQFTQKLL